MIKATSLMPLNWIQHKDGHYARASSLVGILEGNRIEWYINGCPEGEWSGIRLTDKVISAQPWIMTAEEGNEIQILIQQHADLYDFNLSKMTREVDLWGAGTFLINHEKPVDFVHQLEQEYFGVTGEHLKIVL